MEPKVTIIITTYNRAHLIVDRALYSALHQDYDDYEVLVIDHGSTDNTEMVIRNYCKTFKRIRYHKMPVNTGCVTEARNLGAKLAKGEYIVFLDDDNMLYPQYLSEVVPLIETLPVQAVGTGRMIRYKDHEDYAPAYGKNSKFFSLDWGWLLKKDIFNFIQYDKEVFAYEDIDFGLQFSCRYKFDTINKPLQVAFDDGGDSHSYPTPKHLIAMEEFLDKNLLYYLPYPNELRFLYRSYGRRYYMAGYRLIGLKYFWKSFLVRPGYKTFVHLFFILLGWTVYNWYMDSQERSAAKVRLKENKIL